MNDAVRKNWWQRRNWWKIGFFVMLIAFEFMREWAALEADNKDRVSATASVFSVGTYTTATGQWVRTDGGERLMPASVLIECDGDRGECMEVTAHNFTGAVGTPIIDRFKAEFGPDTVSYENDNPDCARYTVRIDLKLEKVIALRERKENPKNLACQRLEKRIEMTLGNSYDNLDDPLKGHFVPIFASIALVFKMLDR